MDYKDEIDYATRTPAAPVPASAGQAEVTISNDEWNSAIEAAAKIAEFESRAIARGIRSLARTGATELTGQAAQVAMVIPHEMGYPEPTTDVGNAFTNGWNACRRTLLGEIPDDPTSDPATERAAAPAEHKRVIEFALELAEHENDDAAVSFLKAWNSEDTGYLRANWPDFATHQPSAQDGGEA